MAINTNSKQYTPAPLIFLSPVFLHSQPRSLSAADSWEFSLINYSSASYRHPPARTANIFALVCTKLTPILFRALDPSGLAVSVARKVLRASTETSLRLFQPQFPRWNFSNFSTRSPSQADMNLQLGQVTCGETTDPLNDLELNKSSLGHFN